MAVHKKLNQYGAIHLLLLVAVIGVIAFLGIASIAPIKDKFLAAIFPKSASEAAAPAMTIISRGKPVFASANIYQPGTAGNVDDNNYDTQWRSNGLPAWIAYDLSSVPQAQRTSVLAVYYNSSYAYSTRRGPHYNNLGSYTIEGNTASGGGQPPTSGWQVLMSVSGNTLHSRQHTINLSNYNWVRINVTVSDGSSGNSDASINQFDLYDISSSGASDDWIFFGDSITAGGLDISDKTDSAGNLVPAFSTLIHNADPLRWPVAEEGGVGFDKSSDGVSLILGSGGYLSLFPGKYVALNYGMNDADPAVFYNNMKQMVDAILAAGKIPVIPKISYTNDSFHNGYLPALNAKIDQLYSDYPQIIKGPDFWTFFQANPNWIGQGADIHPTSVGYAEYRKEWARVMLANVYNYNLLPSDRVTTWNPGLNSVGGIPNRTTICTTVNASTYGNGTQDATAGIQTAINSCPQDQIVQLSAGDFSINSGPININKGIVLRGAGPTQTHLKAPDGKNQPIVVIGNRWPQISSSVNLTANAIKGANSVTVSSTNGLSVGELVLIDETTDTNITEWSTKSPPGDVSRSWFSRMDRPLTQVMEIASISGNTVTFNTPFHIGFDTAHNAQLSRYSQAAVKNAGLEDLHLYGGEGGDGGGNVYMELAKYSWVKNIDSEYTSGGSIHIFSSFRNEIRDSYFHEAKNPQPGGGAYGIDMAKASSDNLVENNISWNFNKVMNMRATGGGNVIAYNYMDDGWINYDPTWMETGLNPAHMTTPHYELFEGNQSFNFDPDNTWGNSIYITAFRNYLTGKRLSAPPLNLTDSGNPRAVGVMEGHWWYTFLGNVLGFPGMPTSTKTWYLGYNPENWNAPDDQKVLSTIIRGGNYEFATGQTLWEGITQQSLPASLYLSNKPAFFGNNPWPWVDAAGATKLYVLPARARFDSIKGLTSTPTPTPQPSVGQSPSPSPIPSTTPAPTPLPTGNGTTLTLYDNAVAAGFSDGTFSFSSKNACDSAQFVSAPCSYSVAYTNWGGVAFNASSPINISNYTSLKYKINPQGQPVSNFSALMIDNAGALTAQIYLDANNTSSLGNGWYQVSIPLSQINPGNALISSVQLKNALNQSLPTIYLDDVEFSGGALPSSSPSPAPSVAPSPSPSSVPSIPPSPSPSPSPKPGDTNGDGKIDIFDYNTVLTDYGKTGSNILGDVDHDGDVDIFDYNLILTNYGR